MGKCSLGLTSLNKDFIIIIIIIIIAGQRVFGFFRRHFYHVYGIKPSIYSIPALKELHVGLGE